MDTNRIPKQTLQYKPKDGGTEEDRGRDGGTKFILRIKEQKTRLTLREHYHDDDLICLPNMRDVWKHLYIENICFYS